jgi:hypothetical protein
MHISIKSEEMKLVAKWEDVKDYINNKENVTEIKWDPFGDNISVPQEEFYVFINKRLKIIYLFRKNTFLNDVAKWATIFIAQNKN